MAIKKVKLMQECSPERFHMRTARLKYDKEIGEECE